MAVRKSDNVHPYAVRAYVDVEVMGVVREALDAAHPNHEVSGVEIDWDRFYDDDMSRSGESTWAIPVKFDLEEI